MSMAMSSLQIAGLGQLTRDTIRGLIEDGFLASETVNGDKAQVQPGAIKPEPAALAEWVREDVEATSSPLAAAELEGALAGLLAILTQRLERRGSVDAAAPIQEAASESQAPFGSLKAAALRHLADRANRLMEPAQTVDSSAVSAEVRLAEAEDQLLGERPGRSARSTRWWRRLLPR